MCRERLAYYKAPGYVAFCNRLPLTPTQKIQRGELKELGTPLLGGPQLHRHAGRANGGRKRHDAAGAAATGESRWRFR